MNKILFASLSLAAALSLSAAEYATVNGTKVTDKDVAFTLAAMPGVTLEQLPKDTQKKVIDETINRKLLLDEAKKSGLDKSDEYKAALEELKNNLVLDLWMKRIFDNIKVSEGEISDFYNKNKAEFAVPAQVRAKHILVATEKDANDIIAALKGLKGDELVKKFEELAKSKSTDQGSAANGGELGWFGQSQMVKPFGDAVFAMSKGEVSKKPVKSNFGYHVILKEDSKAAGLVPFDQVKPQIENAVKMEKFQASVKQKGDALRSKAKIEYK